MTRIVIGTWQGDNTAVIVAALYAAGYRTTTVQVFKGKLLIRNPDDTEVVLPGDEIKLPYGNEPDDNTEEEGGSGFDQGLLEGWPEDIRANPGLSQSSDQRHWPAGD
jgi:hypothetical protein